jgi:O-antigen/teichoic acid export membrane protein
MLSAARMLTQEEFGAFNVALAFAFIGMIVADMGINQLLVRTIARDKALLGKYVVNALWWKALLSAGMFVAFWVLLTGVGYSSQTISITLIMLLFAILGTFTEFMYSIFRSFERMEFDSFLKIARMVLLTVFSIMVLLKGFGVVAFALMFVAVEFAVVVLGFILLSKKFFPFRLKLSWLDAGYRKEMIKEASPFGFAMVFGNAYFYLAIFVLSAMKGEVEVAYYSSAYNIALALLFIPTVFTNALYPVLARLFVESRRKMALVYERAFKYLFLVGLPISILLFVFADYIIVVLYGREYAAAGIVLRIIAAYVALKFLNFLLGIVLSSADRQWERLKAQGIVALINAVLCIILIGKWGFIGAAWATLLTEIVLSGVYGCYVRDVLPSSNVQKGLFTFDRTDREMCSAILKDETVQKAR